MDQILGHFVWIVFWLAGPSYWSFKCWLRHKEREMELRALGHLPQPVSRQSSVELRRVEGELTRLRETTTAYDLTVERELKELRDRVLQLESQLRAAQSGQQAHVPYYNAVQNTPAAVSAR